MIDWLSEHQIYTNPFNPACMKGELNVEGRFSGAIIEFDRFCTCCVRDGGEKIKLANMVHGWKKENGESCKMLG